MIRKRHLAIGIHWESTKLLDSIVNLPVFSHSFGKILIFRSQHTDFVCYYEHVIDRDVT